MRFDTTSTPLHDPLVRALLILLLAIAALSLTQLVWSLVIQFGDLILLFVFAWVIAFLLEPLVASLSRARWIPRAAAVVIVYLTLLVAIAAGITLLAPILVAQSEMVAVSLPELGERLGGFASGLNTFLISRGLSIADYTGELLSPLQSVGPWLVSNAVTLATTTASVLTQVVLALVLSLYFMLDGDRLGKQFVGAFPKRYRDDVAYFIVSVNRTFGGFLRGQIIQSLVYGLGIAVIMLATGLPFVALVSVLGAISIFIPFVGPVLGTVPPIVIAFATDFGRAWIVAVLTLVLNLVVVNVVAPKVMSQQIGLSPIMVLAAVLIGARLGGPWGALFGIPVAAVIATTFSFYQLTVAERERRLGEVIHPLDADDLDEIEAAETVTPAPTGT